MVLIGYWPLQENSGNTAHDYAGSNNGAVNGAQQGAEGLVGSTAYRFDGDYVDLQTTIGNPAQNHSLSAWINTNDSSSQGVIFGQRDTNDGDDARFIVLRGDRGGRINFRTYDGSNYIARSSKGFNDGVWHHVVAVKDPNLKIYIDGNLEGTASGGSPSVNDSDFIGARGGSGGNDRFFDGRIAEVRFYNHALSQAEISYLYNVVNQGRLTSVKKSV